MPVKISIRVNNDLTPADLLVLAEAAEAFGFDELWVSNDLFWRPAPVLLTALAQATTRLGLGCGVFNPCSMHPSEIAMIAAGLQEVSDGRFRLGIGAGADEFLEWARIPYATPVTRTREALVALRSLLAGESPAGWDREGHMRFSAPPPPIYVGAMGPRMLALAGELADGALPLLFPPEHYTTAAVQVAAGIARAGRDARDVDVAACIWCSIDADRERAEAALADKVAYYGSSFSPHLLARAGLTPADFDPIRQSLADGETGRARQLVDARMLSLGVAGSAEEVAARCQGLVDSGARHLSFGPPLGPDPLLAVELIATEVLPLLRLEPPSA